MALRKVWQYKWRVAAVAAGLWGLDFAAGKYRDSLNREIICNKARVYGQQTMGIQEPATHVAVFVSMESGRNAMKLLDRDVLPVLHLGAVDVTVHRSFRPGQARELARGLDLSKTQVVLSVGGDGLLHEVLSGLLTHDDVEQARQVKVGVVPAGTANSLAASLGHDLHAREAKAAGEAALSVLRGKTRPVDVLKITEPHQVSYAAVGVSVGLPAAAAVRARDPGWRSVSRYSPAGQMAALWDWPVQREGVLEYGTGDGRRHVEYVSADAIAGALLPTWGPRRTITDAPPPPGHAALVLVPAGRTRWQWLQQLVQEPSQPLSHAASHALPPVTWFSWQPHDTASGAAVDGELHPGAYVRADVLRDFIQVLEP